MQKFRRAASQAFPIVRQRANVRHELTNVGLFAGW